MQMKFHLEYQGQHQASAETLGEALRLAADIIESDQSDSIAIRRCDGSGVIARIQVAGIAESDGNARLIAAATNTEDEAREIMTTPITHTPGPWKANLGLRTAGTAILGPDAELLASAFNRPLAESEANARLIAAALDLLSALQHAVRTETTWQEMTGHDLPAWYDQARQAIAKATGQSLNP